MTGERVSIVWHNANWLFLSNHSFQPVEGAKTVEKPEKEKTFISEEVVTNCVVFICHNSEKWNQDKSRVRWKKKDLTIYRAFLSGSCRHHSHVEFMPISDFNRRKKYAGEEDQTTKLKKNVSEKF